MEPKRLCLGKSRAEMGDGYRSRGSSGSCRSFGIRTDYSVAAWLFGMERAEPLNGRSVSTDNQL
jgi:hypothetical protein